MRETSLLLFATLLLFPLGASAQGEQWQIGTTPSFSSGRYGTDTRTEVFYTPITARRLFDAGDVAVVVPFTCVRGNGAVTIVNGVPVRQERLDASTSTRTASVSTTRSVTECGLGDVVLRGRYYAVDERGWMPTIAIRAHLKVPTANEGQGLGTGRADEGIGVEITRTLWGGLSAMLDGGYTFIGQPSGIAYNDNWWYDAGVGQDFAREIVNVSVFLEEYRALVPGLPNAREVLAAVSVKGANGWRLQLSGALGLSDGAPDHGFTFGASRRF